MTPLPNRRRRSKPGRLFRGLLAQARSGETATVKGKVLISVMHPAHQSDPGLLAVNQLMGSAIGLAGFARQVGAVLSWPDSRLSLTAIIVPTLVLVGEQDQLTPPDAAREIAAAIPHARLVIIPECGHGSTIEQPQAVNNALLSWLLE